MSCTCHWSIARLCRCALEDRTKAAIVSRPGGRLVWLRTMAPDCAQNELTSAICRCGAPVRRVPDRRSGGPGRARDRGALLRPDRSGATAAVGRTHGGDLGPAAPAGRQSGHGRTGRCRRTLGSARGRSGGGDLGHDLRPGDAARGLRAGRVGSGAARRRPAAAGRAGEPGAPLPRDGTVLPRQPDRCGRRGDDDLDRVGSGQRRGRAAGGRGPTGSGWRMRWARR